MIRKTGPPVVLERDGQAFTNSRHVADYFGKRHDDVLRAIRNLLEQSGNLCARNFAATSNEVPMPNGGTRTERSFDMDRDGFTLLAMGFTGQKATRLKGSTTRTMNASK